MPFLLQYLFKLSLTLAVLYFFYYALLRKLTFYTWNRFYLLGYSLLSFIIPFINITPWIQERPIASSSFANGVNLTSRLNAVAGVPAADATGRFSSYDVALLLFAGGAAIMLIRLLLQFLSLQSIKRKATLIHANSVRLYDVDSPISPFSFAQSIFVNTRRYSEEDLQKIIQHEFVHVKQKHTADLLVSELLCIVNWYNPFAWLIKRAIRQNLEFLADHSVLQTGLDARQYQYLLLQVTGLPRYSVSNNFNISSLKQRIFMMNKLQSARVHLFKFLFVLPLLALILLAFRGQQAKKQAATRLLQHDSGRIYDTVPPKVNLKNFVPPQPLADFLKQNQAVDNVHWKKKDVIILFLKNGDTETYELSKEEARARFRKKYGIAPLAPPPPPLAPPPPPPPSFPKGVSSITISNKATVFLKNGKKEEYDLDNWQEKAAYEKKYGILSPPAPVPVMSPDVIVTGKPTNKTPGKPLPPASPVIVDVLLDTVKVSSEPVVIDVDLDSVIYDKHDVRSGVKIGYKGYRRTGSPDVLPPMIIIDGIVSTAADLNNISPNQIESVSEFAGKSATQLYGARAEGGVMVYKTKSGQAAGNTALPVPGDINSLTNYKGLILINGKEASKTDVETMLSSLRKDPFAFTLNMTMLKKEEAIQKYGDKGKEGAAVVAYQLKNQ